MAAGDSKIFRDFVLKNNEGAYSEGDAWTLSFISNTYASIDADATNPAIASVTITTGGNVVGAYNLVSFAITRTGATITFDADDIGSIAKNASNPADVRCAVIYNNTSAADDLVMVFDLTADGTTALDLVNNDLNFTFGASGLMTATVS